MNQYLNAVKLPYYKLLVAKWTTFSRPTLYHNDDTELNRNTNEWEYMRLYAKSYELGGLIPTS